MNATDPLARLAGVLSRLPGIGKRTADRIAYKLGRDRASLIHDLTAALEEVAANLTGCSRCGNLTLRAENPCRLCSDPRRDGAILCVVEDASDIPLIEKSGGFHGRYHSLGGKISPMRSEGIPDQGLAALLARISADGIKEVLLALNTDVESDATASFVSHALAERNIRVTRLALGIPAGSALAYSDPVTLSRAIQGRQPV